jgi:hypothetical protein
MTHIWQGLLWPRLRSGARLTTSRARFYSLILLAISLLAAAWIVPLLSRGLAGVTAYPRVDDAAGALRLHPAARMA